MTRFLISAAFGALLLTPLAATAQEQDSPGQFDFFVLSLSWSPSFCAAAAERGRRRAANAQCGVRPYSFVMHGLWPQYEKGFPEYCQLPAPRLDRSIVTSMLDLMPAPHLIFNEWDRHGTCSGQTPRAYFETVRKARATVKIPPDYTDVQRPLSVNAARCRRRVHQGQSRFVATRYCDRLCPQALNRSATVFVQGSAISQLPGDREAQLSTRPTRHATDARRVVRSTWV